MKQNGLVPIWKRPQAQVAAFSTCIGYTSGCVAIMDDDPYDCVLRTNAERVAQIAIGRASQDKHPHMAAQLFREAALLVDLLLERQHAKDEKEVRKAARS